MCWYTQYELNAPTIRSSHHGLARISSTHAFVPVVVHVVVVEDHGRRHRGEQPADRRVAPRLPVEPGVLLEVGDLVERGVGVPLLAPLLDELERARRHLVRVDLVAEKHERVRPVLRAAQHPARVRVERVHLPSLRVLVLRQRVRRLVGRGHAAGAEHHPQRGLGIDRPYGGLGPLVVGLRPHGLAIERHRVLILPSRLELVHADERVVVPADFEGAVGGVGEALTGDGDLAGRVGLDPDACVLLPGVAKQGTNHEGGHALYLPTGGTDQPSTGS
jgi:hypothetical protein